VFTQSLQHRFLCNAGLSLVLPAKEFNGHRHDVGIVQQPVEQDLRFVTGQSQFDDYSQ